MTWYVNRLYPDEPENSKIRAFLMSKNILEKWDLMRQIVLAHDSMKRTKYSKFSLEEQNLYSLRDALNSYVTRMMNVDEFRRSAERVFDRKVNIDNDTTVTMSVRKGSTQGFDYYYMWYFVRQNSYVSDIRKVFIDVVPRHTYITGSGLDISYVPAGVFVNKIFDYTSQVPGKIPYSVLAGSLNQYASIGKFMSFDWLP
jgi:hypothetical protein